jgi:crotonobetainyl-CoA:carnitine CoA-transferase CaiB-like acyl-CoA transferase
VGNPKPLQGIRVLDLSRQLAGPVSTQFFADLGADVIKVEQPGKGDSSRYLGPPFQKNKAGEEVGDSPTFLASARGKRAVTIDMGTPEGQALVHDLARKSDILVENFKVGSLAKLGLDYETIRKINPRIIYCSVTGFGQTGPYAKRSGVDSLFQAMSGLMAVTGEPDGQPQRVGFFVGDVVGGLHAVIGVLAALYSRDANGGVGQHIDISLTETMMASMGHHYQLYLTTGEEPIRAGNSSPDGGVPAQPFRCSDGNLQISAVGDPRWATLCRALGVPELGEDPRFKFRQGRIANRAALVDAVEAVLAHDTVDSWIKRLGAAGVVCAPIYTIAQALADPHMVERGVTIEVEHAMAGPMSMMANPIRFSEAEMQYSAPPMLGQHTDEVLSDVLGLDAQKLQDLKSKNII